MAPEFVHCEMAVHGHNVVGLQSLVGQMDRRFGGQNLGINAIAYL